MPWLNIERFRNECSPFSRIGPGTPVLDGCILVDSYYGQAFDFQIREESAVYGATQELPAYLSDKHADRGFLRVPYRRIPRFWVHNRHELEAILALARHYHPGAEVLLRGQSREYYLGRSEATLAALYGDPHALEPSLPASAVRRGKPLESVFVEWCGLLRYFLAELWDQHYSKCSKEIAEGFESETARLESSFDLQLLALSLAQHYGLPSAGLDVTDDLDVALFFALAEFRGIAGRDRYQQCNTRKASREEGVIYAFVASDRSHLNYEEYRPKGLPRGRPDRQRARFLHTGWGLNTNACARDICMALYLDPKGDFRKMPSVENMFPDAEEDLFGRFLEVVLSWDLPRDLRSYLEDFHWVVTA